MKTFARNGVHVPAPGGSRSVLRPKTLFATLGGVAALEEETQ